MKIWDYCQYYWRMITLRPPVASEIPKKPATANFKMWEFESPDGAEIPLGYYENLQKLMEQMEVIRKMLGGNIIDITSGFRSGPYNKKVGGVSDSQHLTASGCDFVVRGVDSLEVQSMVNALMASNGIISGGFGMYNGHTHYDIGQHRWWNNRTDSYNGMSLFPGCRC